MFDIVDRRREHAFVRPYDVALHVLGREAVVVPDHRNDRYVDTRKNILGRAENRQDAGDQDEDRKDDERVRPTKGEIYDPHNDVWSANISSGSVNASFIGADVDGEVTVKSRTCKPTDRSNYLAASLSSPHSKTLKPSTPLFDGRFRTGNEPNFFNFCDELAHMAQCALTSSSSNCLLEARSDPPCIFQRVRQFWRSNPGRKVVIYVCKLCDLHDLLCIKQPFVVLSLPPLLRQSLILGQRFNIISNRPAKELTDFFERGSGVFHHIMENRRDDDLLIVDVEKITENEGYPNDMRKIRGMAIGKSLAPVLDCSVSKSPQHDLRARLQLRPHIATRL